ncbi:MAG TPA: hypothetical protein DEQ32_13770 [Gammaproteobacteria bacterium]|nr:hypothetical protein [Gammaproteobacteria bacterium]|tara:strand:- start:1100 stop:1837 length:738 start_codon:yes stop_codon:yes gene_type:complete
MVSPTWHELIDFHCSARTVSDGDTIKPNPYYEDLARRRYNYSAIEDQGAVRLIFLTEAVGDRPYKTLRRGGRFIWCHNLRYEGKDEAGYRQLSFTVDKGKKRFVVAENNCLCLPSKTYVGNHPYFARRDKTFLPFATPFGYTNCLHMMADAANLSRTEFLTHIREDNPYVPGTLVKPRLGYFYPQSAALGEGINPQWDKPHPCGLILGPSLQNDYDCGRDFYRVRFGGTTYERVHAVEMEILSEV